MLNTLTGPSISRRSFVVAGAAGATASAVAATAVRALADEAVEEAPGSTTRWSWLTAPDPITDIAKSTDYDIVVVGGGLSGAVAAWKAATDGATVALVERTEQINGRSIMVGAVNATIQKDAGLEYDEDEIIDELCRYMCDYTNRDLVAMYVHNSGAVFDAMAQLSQDYGGEPFFWGGGSPYAVDTPAYKEYSTPMGPAASVAELLGYVQADAEATGNFTLYTQTTAEQLVVVDGRVTGVVCATVDNTYIQLNAARGVIMATGDYSGNAEMVEAWSPMINRYVPNSVYTPVGANDGKGLAMMMWAGAAMQPFTLHAPMVGSAGFGLSVNPFLHVNVLGERYENEDKPVSQVLAGSMAQPQGLVWSVFDADAATYCETQTGYNMSGGADSLTEDSIASAIELGNLIQADTIEGLSEAMGVPVDTLTSTVERYNELVASGIDEDYGKSADNLSPIENAPFYAAPIKRCLECMMGGISVDKHLRVLTEAGNPIEGLYAVGNCSGSYFAVDYPAIVTGQSHGRAMTQGYLMGQALAAGEDGVQ